MKSDYYQRHLDADFIKAMKNSSLFMPAAQEDAKNRGMKVKDYLKSGLDLADKFSISDEIVDREEFIEAIQDAIQTNRLTLIVGGKSVGKSKMRKEKTTNRTVLLSDMRDYPSKDYFEAVLTEACKERSLLKKVWNAIKAWLPLTANFQVNPVVGVSLALKDMKTKEKEATLAELISELKGDGVTIIIDEANLALPADRNADQMEIKTAKAALAQITKITKQSKLASVILISSEHGYPYKLALAGLNLQDIKNVIIAPEVPPRFMYDLFVKKWQMGERLARLLLVVCAGSIDLAMTALGNFKMKGEQFYPLGFVDLPGIGTCLVKDGEQFYHFVLTNTVCHFLLLSCSFARTMPASTSSTSLWTGFHRSWTSRVMRARKLRQRRMAQASSHGKWSSQVYGKKSSKRLRSSLSSLLLRVISDWWFARQRWFSF